MTVTCRSVTKRFGDFVALDGVDLDVYENEILGIIGPNGAGKTTLLNCLEGLDEPTSGCVEVLGLDPIKDSRQLIARMGVQLQQAALLPRIKVSEALELFSSFYDKTVPYQPLLNTLGLGSKADSFVEKLSGGERQRVFIALALVHEPELLFLDELTTALDPQARLAIWDVVRGIRSRGKTVVLTTHYMEEAEALCDRVAIIDKGRIVAVDTVAGLAASYGGDSVVRLTLDGPAPEDLQAIDGIKSVTNEGNTLVVSGVGSFQQALLTRLSQSGVTANNVSVTNPGLEAVFLNLTGRTLKGGEE